MLIYVYKFIFILVFALIGYYYPPFTVKTPVIGAAFGAAFAIALTLISIRIRKTDLKSIWSSTISLLCGALIGWVMFLLLKYFGLSSQATLFFQSVFLLGFPVTGLFIGIQKPNMFAPLNIREFFRGSSAFTDSFILDTSAIIDGRILPIAVSGFIQGELIITQFVLAELQAIADSTDPVKKVRGKRGLDVIEKLRSNPQITVTILNKNITGAKTVDQKIVLLAKDQNFKVVTNDINLSRIAKLQDVTVLNVNELSFALKPIVYPGEHLSVHISKIGKEKKQGIGYLEDGTMIVIDDAKTDIGKDLDVEVTSVLQTTSGKMIFGKKV